MVWSDELIVYLNKQGSCPTLTSLFDARRSDEVIAVTRVAGNAGSLRVHGADTGGRVRKDANNEGWETRRQPFSLVTSQKDGAIERL